MEQLIPSTQHSDLLKHLIVLRSYLLRALLTVALIFLGLLYFATDLYHYLALPLLRHLPHDTHMITIGVMAPLLVPVKFTFMFAVFVSMPMILYLLWRFVAPGLYQHERRFIWSMLSLSIGLFYLGVVFAYFVVCPLLFSFMAHFTPAGVQYTPDIGQYLTFISKFLFNFGLGFQVPIAMIIIVRLGLMSVNDLTQKRPYFIVMAFILGMLLTPPDVLSQTLLAIPLCLLFELGLLLARLVVRENENT